MKRRKKKDQRRTNRRHRRLAVEPLEPRRLLASDFGDAPDTGAGTGAENYNTISTDSAPSHVVPVTPLIFMGASVDTEAEALPNAAANGDDVDGALPDDEDGLNHPLADLTLTLGAAPTVNVIVTNTTGSAATLSGWIDYNNNGVFDNATERAQVAVPNGSNNVIKTLTFPAVPSGFTGQTYARFRLSTDAAAQNSTGAASNGEVEDYVATITRASDGTVQSHTKISTGLAGFTASGLESFDYFGSSVASLGDLDGDGVTDLVVGAENDQNVDSSEGAVYVLLMNTGGTVKSHVKISDGLAGFTPSGLGVSDKFGSSVASLGDLDGDGVTDLAVGARNDENTYDLENTREGAVYVLLMNNDGTVKSHVKISDGLAGFTPSGLDSGDYFGSAVASLGDLDGDGVSDLAVGAYYDDYVDGYRGAVYVLLMNSNGTVKSHVKISDGLAGFTPSGLGFGDRFGSSLASLGDLDGDGVADLAVGARRDENTDPYEGAVYVLLMKNDGTVKSHTKISDGLAGFTPGGLGVFDYFGSSVVSLGDLDGDGVPDLAVGARRDDSEGAVHMLLLNSDGTVKSHTKISDGLAGFTPSGLIASDYFGSALAILGDLDGDGVMDLAVGASGDENTEFAEGAVYVLLMNSDGTVKSHTKISTGLAGFTASGLDSSDHFGSSVASLGDLDGDGVTDLVVGAGNDQNVDSTEGAVYVLLMNTGGTVKSHVKISDGLAGFTPSGLDAGDNFGSSVASLGDLDGDGVTDLAVGASGDENTYDLENTREGAVYVLLMNSNGTVKSHVKISDGLAGFTPSSLEGSDSFGSSVASLGDLDGDGVTDLAVGASLDENAGSTEGAIYVLLMNSNGTVKSDVKISDGLAGFTPSGLDSGDRFGNSVASLGDLDGDGVADLAVGAVFDQNTDSSEGAVYVLLMKNDGTVKSHTKISDGLAGFMPSGLEVHDNFGSSVASLGDLDGDGVTDLAVGAVGDENTTEFGEGAVYVLLMNSNGTVKSHTKISDGLAGFTPNGLGQEDFFGSSVASLGDLDGDGVTDLAVGADHDENAFSDEGAVYVLRLKLSPSDFGDAPDPAAGTGVGNYQTVLANSGPSHAIVAGLLLGDTVDADSGTLQNALANADDVDGALPDDEDGVLDPLDLLGTEGAAATVTLLVTNTTGRTATLSGWIDFNADGLFDNGTERAQATVVTGTTDGRVILTFPAVPTGSAGATYARFRLSTDAAGQNSTGAASDGEVEDYVFSITVPANQPVTIASHTKISDGLAGFTPSGLIGSDQFGSALASLGDLDGDGVVDLAVGASRDENTQSAEGAVYVLLMNSNGTVKSHTKISDGLAGFTPNGLIASDFFGSALASLGDLDGDGVVDLAVGASGDENTQASEGAVYVLLMNSNGTVKSHTKISDGLAGFTPSGLIGSDQFGSALAGLGDLDGDGVVDLAVGASGDENTQSAEGAVYVLLMNSNGTVKSHTKISDGLAGFTPNGLIASDHFGSALASLGDLDGDGVVDLAVGASGDENTQASEGAVYVLLMNSNGTVKSHTKISDGLAGFTPNGLIGSDQFGSALTGLGDLDGDGLVDLAVGASGDENTQSSEGAVYVLLLNSNGTVKGHTKISDGLAGFAPNGLIASDRFGSALASLGDLDGDGVVDLAVGANFDENTQASEGAVYVLSMLAAPLQAAQGVAPVSDTVAAALHGKDLNTIARAAINLYAKSGLSATQLQSLRQVDVRIADLSGGRLGQASGNVITIDINAAGYGWFVDGTPLKNEEFTAGSSGLLAAGDSAASGRMDLLTVVLHELGHILGYDDHDSQSDINDLMYGELATGLRKLPMG